jgi:hypothetical protein
MTTTKLRLPALIGAAALALSACGGAGSSGSPAADRTSSSSPTPSATSSSPATSPSASAPPTSAPARTEKPVPAENNPPGDIPDNLAFVGFSSKAGRYSFTHPEGWARTMHGVQVQFTDKLNGVRVDSTAATTTPTVSSARSQEVPRLRSAVPAFELRSVSTVSLPAGRGVHIVFRRNSDPDQVTGKVYRDEDEEYLVYSHGRLVRMDLFGPVGADNVDAYRTMSQSLRIR